MRNLANEFAQQIIRAKLEEEEEQQQEEQQQEDGTQ